MTGDEILSTVGSTTSGISDDGISSFKSDGISGEEIFLRFIVSLDRNRTIRRSGKSEDFIICLSFGLSKDRINGIAIFGRAGYEIFGVWISLILKCDDLLRAIIFRNGVSGNARVAIFGDQMLGISKYGILRDENNDFLTLGFSTDGILDNSMSGKTGDGISSDSGFCLAANLVFVVKGTVGSTVLLLRFVIFATALTVLLVLVALLVSQTSIWWLFSNSDVSVIIH